MIFGCFLLIYWCHNSLQMSGKTFQPELAVMKMHLTQSFLVVLMISLNCVFGLLIGDKHWLELVMSINIFAPVLVFFCCFSVSLSLLLFQFLLSYSIFEIYLLQLFDFLLLHFGTIIILDSSNLVSLSSKFPTISSTPCLLKQRMGGKDQIFDHLVTEAQIPCLD